MAGSTTEPPPLASAGRAHGSAFDATYERPPARELATRARRWLTHLVVGVVARVVPYLYLAYCWLVWRTSRVEDHLTPALMSALDRHGRFVGLLWHQEVFSVAYAYRSLRPHTVASVGHLGRIITHMLEACGFQVFRGGSSRKKGRRRDVLDDMIQHMHHEPRVGYGITVDGANGPIFRMKRGGPVIARACRAPVYVVRGWSSRRLVLRTWDRSAIPLPFGRIKMWAVGPYWLDPRAPRREIPSACDHLERELLELAWRSFEELGPAPPVGRPEAIGFPPGWTPRWQAGQLGVPLGPYDLQTDDAPPWAARPGEDPVPAPPLVAEGRAQEVEAAVEGPRPQPPGGDGVRPSGSPREQDDSERERGG